MMKPIIIKTEEQYVQALEQVDALFDAESGSPEADELELWVKLVEMYENEHFAIDLPDPISAIKFRMEQDNLLAKDLIPYIGSASKVSEVLSGKRGFSLAMIRKLHLGLGIPADVFMQDAPDPHSDHHIPETDFRHFPINEMLKRNWFPNFKGNIHEAKRKLPELMSAFLKPLGTQEFSPALGRKSLHLAQTFDPHALAAWRIRVISLALSESLPQYDKAKLNSEFYLELVKLSYFEQGPNLAKEFLNKAGIHLVIEKHLPKTHMDGAAVLLHNGAPLIALTLRYDRIDNFWFTLFHELAHVALHLSEDNIEIIDELSGEDGHTCEAEANQFARDHLIPIEYWDEDLINEDIPSEEAVEAFADELRISPAIPAGRIRYELNNYFIYKDLLGQGRVRNQFGV